MLVCPVCRVGLAKAEFEQRERMATVSGQPILSESLHCPQCGTSYPVTDGIADFSRGLYYDHFSNEIELTAEHRTGLDAEVSGTRWRIERFYGPLLPSSGRVLDCGCGNGVSVDVMAERGIEAWGVDLSALRKWQWRERTHRDRLVVANALRLPFADGSFDVVISSGVIEHIGVAESRMEDYVVEPLPDREELRECFVAELLRVTKKGGAVFIDVPNGRFPIDFWHGTVGGGARWHRLDEGFLPSYGEVVLYSAAAKAPSVRALSPHQRFAFKQVGRHWYGRLLSLPVALLFRAMNFPGLRWLARTALNPYLVIQIQKP